MSVMLLVLGIVVTGAGVVTIGFGIPNNEFGLGNTLIIAGTTAFSSGLVLVGLAAAVGQLTRIAESLRARPVARPARAAEGVAELPVAEPPRPQPVPAAAEPLPRDAPPLERVPAADSVDVSASALERLRSSMAKPEPEAPLIPSAPSVRGPAGEPPAETPSRPAAAVESPGKPRLDFLFRSKSAPAPADTFDAVWPKRAAPTPEQSNPEQTVRRSGGNGVSPPGSVPFGAPAHATESRPATILKSGVVDGMAYTLYADGSIEAQLPQGTVRFGSIAELRAHIENNS
jgi:hypothetical protein